MKRIAFIAFGVFLHYDGVRASGKHGAGENADAGAGFHCVVKYSTGWGCADEAQRDGCLGACGRDVVRSHCVAVHGGVVEGRQVHCGANCFGEESAKGVRQGDGFDGQCGNWREDFFAGLLDGVLCDGDACYP